MMDFQFRNRNIEQTNIKKPGGGKPMAGPEMVKQCRDSAGRYCECPSEDGDIDWW